MARVKVPIGAGIPRFLRVGDGHHLVPLEEVMAHNLDLLFPNMEIDSCELFRVTRNANTERDEEQADDLVAMIESELRDRRFAPIVRLEVIRGTGPRRRYTGRMPQMSRAYSWIVRSLENLPMRATLRIAFRAQCAGWPNSSPTRACASM